MGRRMRRAFARGLAGACLTTAVAAPGAHALTTDLTDFNLAGAWNVYPTQFHISSGGSAVQYRWLTSTSHDNIVSAIDCSGTSELGAHYFNSGVTAWRGLYSGAGGSCFKLRGRTAGGASMTGHDGRVDR